MASTFGSIRCRGGAGSVALSAVMVLTACGRGHGDVPEAVTGKEAMAPWTQPVPRAQCGADDLPETGLQGQVSKLDRSSGRSLSGYRCNLELVGQYAGEGASWQMAWYDDCAYFDTAKTVGITTNGLPSRPAQANPGVVVVDVSDAQQPNATAFLDTEAMLDPWESLKVNQKRGLLAAVDGAGSGGSAHFDIYDISGDCRQPQLLASREIGEAVGHAGEFAPDGMTYYGTDTGRGIRAIDVSDPANPQLIAEGFPVSTHDISTSLDGTLSYQAVVGLGAGPDNGLAILDVSQIQQRVANPQVAVISEVYWEDGAAAQMTQEFRQNDRLYVLFADEGLSSATKAGFCNEGLPPFGMARIFDVTDPAAPQLVAKLMLEIHDPDNCALTTGDGENLFGYDSHYCTVDDVANATMVACGHFESGLRVFDIRDLYRPREIAYYNPPARPGYQAGSNFNSTGTCEAVDWATSMPRFRLDRGEIWFTSQCNGFQVVSAAGRRRRKRPQPIWRCAGRRPAVARWGGCAAQTALGRRAAADPVLRHAAFRRP
jgi:hypothetical protein